MPAEFITFFVILLAGLFLSTLFNRLHLPWVVALIVAGIIIGPHGLDLARITPTFEFLGEIGLVFLMFMAGLETRLSTLRTLGRGVATLMLLNGLVPFAVGYTIASYFGYGSTTALILGIVFMSSSIAVIVPSLESAGLLYSKIGKIILSATILEDIASLLLLSVVLQSVSPITRMPLPLFVIVLIISLVVLRWLIPRVEAFMQKLGEGRGFEYDVRSIFTILLGIVILFQFLGLHAITAGFFAGLLLSDSMKQEITKQKLHVISYGLFIPIFFIIIGSKANLGVFFEIEGTLLLVTAVVLGSVLSKFLTGWIGGKLNAFGNLQSGLVGSSTIPSLSTSLAVAFIGFNLGIFNQPLMNSIIVLSIVTTLFGPILIRSFAGALPKIEPEKAR